MKKDNKKENIPVQSGYVCSCCSVEEPEKKKSENHLRNEIIKLSIVLVFLIAGFFDWKAISESINVFIVFYYVNPAWVSIILCGFPIFKGAIKTIQAKKIRASVLISIAMLSCIALEIISFVNENMSFAMHNHSYVFAAGEIAFLMAVGEFLEDMTVKKCRSGIERLVSLIPKVANVMIGKIIIVKKIKDIKIGDRVLVKSGEKISVDGEVVKGSASIDQSAVTGEFIPKEVSVGDNVFGGTINTNGVIEIEVKKLYSDMTISKMAELVEEAEGKKAPISRLADKWVSVIVPSVIIISIIVFFLANFALKVGTLQSVVRAITILVVFCPCALVLATPTAIAAGLGNSAKNGVLIKNGASLEVLKGIDTICFDKTGTITEGKIELTDIYSTNGMEKDELLKISASLEKYSEHPIAKAVIKKYNKEDYFDVKNIKVNQGVGIEGVINNKNISIITKNKVAQKELLKIEKLLQEISYGKTITIVMEDEKVIGIMAFSDKIRDNAPNLIKQLNEKYNTIMLTGDNKESANYIAKQCGISEVRADLLPENKLEIIEDLKNKGHKVCMIGDGINDAPALKLADTSFAMGSLGSDIVLDTADITILNSDLTKIKTTLSLSKRVMNTIKRNIIIAMSVNVLALIASLFGWLTPVTGALVHNCTSVFVVICSTFLLRTPKKDKISIVENINK